MPTNKPEVVLPEAPPIPAHLFDKDQSIVWAAAWETLRKHVADTLTRPAAGDFVMVPREATPGMLADFWHTATGSEGRGFPLTKRQLSRARKAYAAMLSAAPQQPVEDGLARIAGMTFLLHENPDADDDIPPTQLVMAMSVGDTVYCHRVTHGNNGICRDDAPQQHGQEVRTCMNPCSYIDFFNGRACDKCLGTIFSPAHFRAQQPAEAVYLIKDDFGLWREQTKAEHDWWDGKQNAPARRVLYTAPPPAIDIGKLRELVSEWRNDAKHKVIRVMAKQQLADADQLAALIGDGGERQS